MAEFALGLTKTAVAGTVSRVKSAIDEEKKLRVSVQDDLVFITGEFEMMQSFLSASNTGDRASKNLVVRTWVRQLRDLAFDVEDCVEYIIHLDQASWWDYVRRLASPVRVCMGKSPLPLDVAAEEIKRLKARVEDVSQRNNRYNLITGDTSQADAHHQITPYTYTGSSKASSGTLQALLDVWTRTGRFGGHTAIDLKKLIDSDVRELQVISLWHVGSADVGDDAPSSLSNYAHTMTMVYDDPVICQRFKNRAWVKLSALHPFNPVEFINNLLNQFRSRHHHHEDDHENIANRSAISELRYLLNQFRSRRHHQEDDDDHHNHANADSTISEFLQQLSKLRYLVVLENELNTVADWDAIRMYLPDGKEGSRVVVSTNSLGIARVCTGTTYQVSELQRFSHDQGLYAFFPKGCGHRIGMGEFFWQLRCSSVICVFSEGYDDYCKFNKFTKIDAFTKHDKPRVLGAEEFERREIRLSAHGFDLVKFARGVILRSYPDGQQSSVHEELEGMSDQDIIERSCKLLTERTYLVFIENLQSTEDWDSIKQKLLCESTRSRIVIVALLDKEIRVATHCVDHDANRALNARDLLQELGDGGGNVKEEEARHCELVGRHFGRHFRRHFDSLLGSKRPAGSTVSLWGIAGVGKTAIAREMYKRKAYEFNMRGWVDVPYPFDLTELCRRLLLDFYSHDIGAMESAAISMTEGQDPIQWCCQILRASKWILVLDGLRSTHDWDVVKATLLSQPTAGQTLVITREESIATYCMEERARATWNITGLKEDDALLLFEKIAFEGKKLSELDPEEEKSLKLLVSKCGGLPELIVAVGKSVKAHHMWIVEELNSNFIETLQTYSSFTSLRGLFRWMHSYFDAVSDELKPCIFYMLVFPADQSIRWKRLLNRWISEGYLPGGSGTMEEKGKRLLLDLMNLSILYGEWQEEQQHISSHKVNGFFREYIKSSPMEDNLVLALEEESRSTSSRINGQHLTIRESWKRDSYEFSMMDVSRLRSLTVSGVWESFLISDKMKVLRVLDLEGTSTTLGTSVTDNDLEEIVKQFPRLKFLSLRECVHITRLPDSLGEMRQLQTLDVRYTSIVELPSSITKLHKLQYIRAGTSTAESMAEPPPSTPTPPRPAAAAAAEAPAASEKAAPAATTEQAPAAVEEAAPATLAAEEASAASVAWKRKAQDLVKSSRSSWQKLKNRKNLHRRQRVAANGGGVEFVGAAAEGFGSLIHLHTLGVVNVAGRKGGLVFLKELKKLAQLRKLSLSGINDGNWSKLCDAIRGEPGVPVVPHLESLSLKLMLLEADGGSYEFACFDDHFQPPKSLKRFKILYTSEGQVASIGLAWINKLPNLKKFNHELTISTQEDIHVLGETGLIPVVAGGWRLRIKPNVEDLSFEACPRNINMNNLRSLRVECSSNLSRSKVTFGSSLMWGQGVSAISIHCCCCPSAGTSSAAGSSSSCGLQISGLQRMHEIQKVTVMGPCGVDLERDLRDQLDKYRRTRKPVLELKPAETQSKTQLATSW